MALRVRDATGEGQCVELGLYEPIFRVLDELVPAYQQGAVVRERMGADTVNVCPHSHYQTRDGKWIAIACSSDAMFERLARAMGQPALAGADGFGAKEKRLAEREQVNRLVQDWVGSLDCDDVLRRCEESGTPASLIYSIAEIFTDPQYRARENIQMHPSRIGPLAVPGVVPRLSETPGAIRWLGDGLGAHNEEVLCGLLGLSRNEVQDLRTKGVV
jgi:crotonobetainyl-CoA:carnitine CoA-transferase CaiB-like acyl-CoA transferase